jgi:hypothetical protein
MVQRREPGTFAFLFFPGLKVKLFTKVGYGYINTFTSDLSSANQFYIDASNNNLLISDVFGADFRAVTFKSYEDATVFVQPHTPSRYDMALNCSTASPGAGLLTCTVNTDGVIYNMLQLCNDGNDNILPTGISIDTQVDAGCQAIRLTAVPVCAVV